MSSASPARQSTRSAPSGGAPAATRAPRAASRTAAWRQRSDAAPCPSETLHRVSAWPSRFPTARRSRLKRPAQRPSPKRSLGLASGPVPPPRAARAAAAAGRRPAARCADVPLALRMDEAACPKAQQHVLGRQFCTARLHPPLRGHPRRRVRPMPLPAQKDHPQRRSRDQHQPVAVVPRGDFESRRGSRSWRVDPACGRAGSRKRGPVRARLGMATCSTGAFTAVRTAVSRSPRADSV